MERDSAFLHEIGHNFGLVDPGAKGYVGNKYSPMSYDNWGLDYTVAEWGIIKQNMPIPLMLNKPEQ